MPSDYRLTSSFSP